MSLLEMVLCFIGVVLSEAARLVRWLAGSPSVAVVLFVALPPPCFAAIFLRSHVSTNATVIVTPAPSWTVLDLMLVVEPLVVVRRWFWCHPWCPFGPGVVVWPLV